MVICRDVRIVYIRERSAQGRHLRRSVKTRLFLASIAVVSALAVVPYGVDAQKPTPKKGALPKSNQVYVKIILPTDPATRDKDRPVVESWIAEQFKKRGQSKFTAATAWVPLADKGEKSTSVWDATLDGKGWNMLIGLAPENTTLNVPLCPPPRSARPPRCRFFLATHRPPR